ncbi:MAG: Uma2 family endonuclease [Chloroflexi bacterium]|nr:Uma2 family endonuclease [Chloroflexota bacterium]
MYGAETRFLLARGPDVVLGPDAAFVRTERLPPEAERDGFLALAPDLVVESVSPSDRAGYVQDKIMEYLDAGVRLVWLVDPRRRTVTEYQADGTARVLRETDRLGGGDVLCEFNVPIADLLR